MRKIPLIIFSAAVILTLQSCASTKNVPVSVRTNIYNADYNSTFKAIVQTLSKKGYIVKDINTNMGIINTGFTHNSHLAAFLVGNKRVKINALVSKAKNGTKVRLTITVQKKAGIYGWRRASMTKSKAREYYQTIFKKIGEHLN